MNIAEERFYFYNDLSEYTHSAEGKALQAAFNGGDYDTIAEALEAYYNAREYSTFHYNSEAEREEWRERDKRYAEYLHSID